MTLSSVTRAVVGAAGVLAATAALAPAAQAALVQTTTDCGTPSISQPFSAWGDSHGYKLVGGFEDGGAGWTGGRIVAGNEPWHVGGATDASSLIVPAGATAASPPVCVGHDEPTLRYFGHGGNALASVAVGVQVTLLGGLTVTLPIGVDNGAAWAPSPSLHMLANYLPPAGQYTAVRFTFTPLLGDWQLDDVFVDPRAKF